MAENQENSNESEPTQEEQQKLIENLLNSADDAKLDVEDELLADQEAEQVRRLPRAPQISDMPPTPTAEKRNEIRPPQPKRDR